METKSSPSSIADHIESTPSVCGGKPRIAGTRIRVQDIYVWYELENQTVEDIVTGFPQLTPGDIHAALAYLWDHREEIIQQMAEQEAFVEKMRQKHTSPLQEKLKRNAANDSLPS